MISKARFSVTYYKPSDVEVSLETKLILSDVHPSCSKVGKLVQDQLGVLGCEAAINSGRYLWSYSPLFTSTFDQETSQQPLSVLLCPQALICLKKKTIGKCIDITYKVVCSFMIPHL